MLNGWHGMAWLGIAMTIRFYGIIRLCSAKSKPQWTYTRFYSRKIVSFLLFLFHSAFSISLFAIHIAEFNVCFIVVVLAPWRVRVLAIYVHCCCYCCLLLLLLLLLFLLYACVPKCWTLLHTLHVLFWWRWILWMEENWFSSTPCNGRSLQSSVQYKTGICVYPTWKIAIAFLFWYFYRIKIYERIVWRKKKTCDE